MSFATYYFSILKRFFLIKINLYLMENYNMVDPADKE